jgi:hypothetical protein
MLRAGGRDPFFLADGWLMRVHHARKGKRRFLVVDCVDGVISRRKASPKDDGEYDDADGGGGGASRRG